MITRSPSGVSEGCDAAVLSSLGSGIAAMLKSSLSHVDRYAVWGARPASVLILLGLSLLVGAGAVFDHSGTKPGLPTKAAVVSSSLGSSLPDPECLPGDQALGNEGGDPYGFYVFNRNEALAQQRASCRTTLAEVPDEKRTPFGLYLTPQEALALKANRRALFIDVRAPAELQLIGFPLQVDVNIPIMLMTNEFDPKKGEYKLVSNGHFLTAVKRVSQERGFGRDDPLILICRSGNRSANSAKLLHEAGFSQVYNVVEGFEGDKAADGPRKGARVVNGWRNAGLPWTQTISAAQAYPDPDAF
jgi:rhodanese-related sulfurtransferase